MKYKYKVNGLDCANCTQKLEDALNKKESNRRIEVLLDDDAAVKEGMVCGGQMDVWIETQNI